MLLDRDVPSGKRRAERRESERPGGFFCMHSTVTVSVLPASHCQCDSARGLLRLGDEDLDRPGRPGRVFNEEPQPDARPESGSDVLQLELRNLATGSVTAELTMRRRRRRPPCRRQCAPGSWLDKGGPPRGHFATAKEQEPFQQAAETMLDRTCRSDHA